MQKVQKRYLVRETTDADSVYYIGLFPSYSDAQAFIDGFFTGPERAEASWPREVVDVEKLVPGFMPVEALIPEKA
jgi:hypothetical protein